jgi:hypothetical protein
MIRQHNFGGPFCCVRCGHASQYQYEGSRTQCEECGYRGAIPVTWDDWHRRADLLRRRKKLAVSVTPPMVTVKAMPTPPPSLFRCKGKNSE